ncbi:MAG TPA: monovalent cation/H(+) antiporter subunit G [Bryobacteraceae bacterium]
MNTVVAALLVVAVASAALSAAGVLLSRNVYQRLHFLAPAGTVGVCAAAAAIVLHEWFSQAGIKAALTGVVLFVGSPLLTHATARAARARNHGHWKGPAEK